MESKGLRFAAIFRYGTGEILWKGYVHPEREEEFWGLSDSVGASGMGAFSNILTCPPTAGSALQRSQTIG